MSERKAQFISPDAYPQLVPPAAARDMARILRSSVTAVRGARVIDENGDSLRGAVRTLVAQMEAVGGDHARLSDLAHEVKGLAETASMLATGRIAEGLCRYFDECERHGLAPEAAVVALHMQALGRTARDPDLVSQMSDVVARELAVLADRRLVERRGRAGA